MSEQESESAADTPGGNEAAEGEGVDGLQESNLDSVTGGGDIRQPLADLQDPQQDTIKKNGDPEGYEDKESGGREQR